MSGKKQANGMGGLPKIPAPTKKDVPTEPDEYAGCHPDVVDELRRLPRGVLPLPSDYVPFTISARFIYTELGNNDELFRRGGKVVELSDEGLSAVTPEGLRSRLEANGRRIKSFVAHRDQPVLKLKRCPTDTAKALLACRERDLLPAIELLADTSVLFERAGELVVLGPGFHRDARVLVRRQALEAEEVPLEIAVTALLDILSDFRFATLSDKSRAVANTISSALRQGRLIDGDHLVNCIGAENPRTGKGYLAKVQRSVYGPPDDIVSLVSQKDNGVGSLDEQLDEGLLSCKPFILYDNIREKINSAHLEAILTHGGKVGARVAFKRAELVDARGQTVQLTSNGWVATVDLSFRTMQTMLVMQPKGFRFKRYPEGSVLQHIAARRSFYLGSVYAVVKHWHALGKPMLPTEHRHPEWVGSLDWIVQEVFGLQPLLEGNHAEAIRLHSHPMLKWLRAVGLELEKRGVREPVRTIQLAEIALENADSEELSMPGVNNRISKSELAPIIGRRLRQYFEEDNKLSLGGTFEVLRITRQEYDQARKKRVDIHWYSFLRMGSVQLAPIPGPPQPGWDEEQEATGDAPWDEQRPEVGGM